MAGFGEKLTGLRERVYGLFDALSPERKRFTVIAGLVGLVLAAGYVVSMKNPTGPPAPPPTGAQTKNLGHDIDPSMLEKSQYAQSEKALREFSDGLKSVKDEIQELKKEKDQRQAFEAPDRASYPPGAPPFPTPVNAPRPAAAPAITAPNAPAVFYPPAPPASGASAAPGPQGAVEAPAFSDGIVVFKNNNKAATVKKEEDKKKAETMEEVYLPPSFMAATLLSGLDAPAAAAGRANPLLVLIRINDLAVLPNRVKADLKGCFFIAHGYGDLAAERAYLQIVSLSCLAKNGGAVIDQELQGFVVDDDGKIGLQGTPVARFGKAMYAAAISGVFKGVGDVLKSSSQITTVPPAGGVSQVFDKDQMSVAAVGGGLSGAFDKMYEFYIRLAEMSMPVIEVGANKDITVVIQKGVSLKIMRKPGGVKS